MLALKLGTGANAHCLWTSCASNLEVPRFIIFDVIGKYDLWLC